MLPFLLKPYLKKVIWGGTSLAPFKDLPASTDLIGESWEVSAIPGCESIVASGPMQGLTLREVCANFSDELLGQGHNGDEFPLLIKFIDAEHDLSVQVHPGEYLARQRHGCSGKCEMWHIIKTRPGTRLGAGLREHLSPDDFTRRVADGSITDALGWYETHPGDTFYLPAGSVHAIGGGNMLLEVQQPSDITYRLYDYGRGRDLHIDLALDAIDFSVPETCRVEPHGETLISTPNFKVDRIAVSNTPRKLHCPTVFALVCIDGHASVTTGDNLIDVPRGHTLLVPANTHVTLTGSGTVVAVTP